MAGVDRLEKLRREVDRIDKVILTALTERMNYMPEIARLKHQRNISLFQEKREKELMKELKKMAKEEDLDGEFVEEIFLSIFNEAKRLQQEEMNNLED